MKQCLSKSGPCVGRETCCSTSSSAAGGSADKWSVCSGQTSGGAGLPVPRSAALQHRLQQHTGSLAAQDNLGLWVVSGLRFLLLLLLSPCQVPGHICKEGCFNSQCPAMTAHILSITVTNECKCRMKIVQCSSHHLRICFEFKCQSQCRFD